MTPMNKKPNKPGPRLTSEDSFDLQEAKESYVAMPTWERLALWFALGVILLDIIGDLIW